MQEFIKMISENLRLEQFGWALDLLLAAILGFCIGLERKFRDTEAGIESNIDTVLVLSGVTKESDLSQFPYQPKYVLNGVGDILK